MKHLRCPPSQTKLPIGFACSISFPRNLCLMADSENSSSNGVRNETPSNESSADSRSQGTSDQSKLEFSEDEEMLIIRMFNLVGERWSLIAGRIPGRTAEEIEKYWTSRHSTSEMK